MVFDNARAIGRSATSRTVTLIPCFAADAANSKPMKPAPITTAFFALSMRARKALASSSVRRKNTFFRSAPGTGSGRLRAPVAKHEMVVFDHGIVLERDLAAGAIDRHRAFAGDQFDLMLP